MRKLSRNFSLPSIKINNNSTNVNIKPCPISKTTNTINYQNSKAQPFKLRNNLLFYIKFKPSNDKKNQISSNEIINIKDNKNISLMHPDKKQIFKYSFDYIFDENVNQNAFFEKGIKNLIEEFFKGKNICIFNYGNINSGKTSISEIMLFTLKEIFIKTNLLKVNDYILKYSLFEINNEKIIDLLRFQKGKNNYLCLKEDQEIKGITEIIIKINNK